MKTMLIAALVLTATASCNYAIAQDSAEEGIATVKRILNAETGEDFRSMPHKGDSVIIETEDAQQLDYGYCFKCEYSCGFKGMPPKYECGQTCGFGWHHNC